MNWCENGGCLKLISYPISIVVVNVRDKFYGQAAVWSMQTSFDPLKVVTALGHNRKTASEMYGCGSSIFGSIGWATDLSIVRRFGRQTQWEVDKFEDLKEGVDFIMKDGSMLLKYCKYVVTGKFKPLYDEGTHRLWELRGSKVFENVHDLNPIINYKYGEV